MPVLQVRVTELRPTIQSLAVELAGASVRAQAGLLAAAKLVQAKAKSNMSKHRYNQRAENATDVWVSFESPTYLRISVGIKGNTFAPEGKTFEVGWHSTKGLQPPVAPMAEWALRKGLAKTPAQATAIGYVIARNIGQQGYSFDQYHWLSDAFREIVPGATALVARYVGASWAGQPRVPRGMAGAGQWTKFLQ